MIQRKNDKYFLLRSLNLTAVCFIILFLFLTAGCNQNESGKKTTDTTRVSKDTIVSAAPVRPDSTVNKNSSLAIDTVATAVLKYIKSKNYKQLASFFHPEQGVRFSPYSHIDTLRDKRISAKEFVSLALSGKKIKWGIFDGSGEPIIISLDAYFKRFVYDVDFLQAKKITVNKITSYGNNDNNIKSVYPASSFIEFYFPGFKPELDGMDFKALRLVFAVYKNKPYLIAIIHDQWTV